MFKVWSNSISIFSPLWELTALPGPASWWKGDSPSPPKNPPALPGSVWLSRDVRPWPWHLMAWPCHLLASNCKAQFFTVSFMTFQKTYFLLTILFYIEDILIRCLRCGQDWILGSAYLVTRLLINGTVCQFVVLTPAVLTVLKVYVSRMEPKTLKLCMSVEIVALYGVSLCLLSCHQYLRCW